MGQLRSVFIIFCIISEQTIIISLHSMKLLSFNEDGLCSLHSMTWIFHCNSV